MLTGLWDWWQTHFLLSLAFLGLGLLVIAPVLLIPSWRKRFLRSNMSMDIEGIGIVAFVVFLIVVGCYNYLGSSGGT